MLMKFKRITEQYIEIIGESEHLLEENDVEITDEEYNNILSVIHLAPHEDGKNYRLKTDLTWEEYDVEPIEVEEEPSAEELLNIITGENE